MVKLGRLSPLTEQLRNSSRVEDHLWSQKMEQAGARKIEVEIRKKVLVASMSANDASVELLKEQLNKSEAKKAKLQGFLVNLKRSSVALQADYKRQQEQHARDEAAFQAYHQREVLLVRRCETAERRVEQLEEEKSEAIAHGPHVARGDGTGNAGEHAGVSRSGGDENSEDGLQAMDPTNLKPQMAADRPAPARQGKGWAAVDIAQHWLGRLVEGLSTLDHVAEKLLAEVVNTKKCPMQCVVACIVSLLTECSHNFGGLQPTDDFESSGKPPSLWLGDGIVEDVNFSGCWYDDTQREQHRMTTIIAFVAAFEGKQAEIRDEPRILGVLVHELTRILLVEGRRCGAAGQDCGNCAMATALFLLYRTQGRPQAARVFLLDLLLCYSSRKLELALPCLAAALTTWPHILEEKQMSGSIHGSLLCLLKTGLEELCFKVAENSTSQPDDVTLTDVSGTTTSAAGYCGPDTAAFHLEILGRELWGWQDVGIGHRANFLVLAEGALDKIWIVCLEQFIQNEVPEPALLSNFCRIAAAFEGTDWVCREVALNKLVPFLRRDDRKQECSTAFCSQIFDVLLDVCELGMFQSDPGKRESWLTWTHTCQDIFQMDVQNRVQNLRSICV